MRNAFMAMVVSVATTCVSASLASADPATYSGTLGATDIVVEFTDDPTVEGAAPSARYFYVKHGIDIPLHGRVGQRGFEMDEEEACGADACADGKPAPIAATWRLSVAGTGRLEGTWTGRRTLPVKLSRVASRPQPEGMEQTPRALYEFSGQAFYARDEDITMQNSPYDYLRLDVPMAESDVKGWPDATYRYVHDTRTVFPMPRIVDLAGGVSADKANDLLRNRHWFYSRAALSCAALRYRGFSENDPPAPWEGGSLGGIDESTSEVKFLSPMLMSWQESGSIYCGGAHPHNYRDNMLMEVATGTLLGLDDMFTDVADGLPGRTLAAFVRDARGKPESVVDAEFDKDCGISDLIGTNLAAHLRRDGDETTLVFGLVGLPHAMGPCEDDVLEIRALDAQALFTPRFAAMLVR